jgi:hypothetical protein
VESPDIHYAVYSFKGRLIYTGGIYQLPYTDYSTNDRYMYLDKCNICSGMTFVNAQLNVSITKQVVNSDTTRNFVFNVFFAQLNIDTGGYSPLSEGAFNLTYTNPTGDEPDSAYFQQRSDLYHKPINTTDWYGNAVTSEWSVAQIELAPGQTVTIEGLPLGVVYDIVEVPVANYTVSATAANGSQGSNNNIVSTNFLLEDESVTFTNTYVPPENSVDLTISKVVTGNMRDPNQAFSFAVTLTDADGNPLRDLDIPVVLPNGNAGVYATDSDGVVTFSLQDEQQITLEDLPQGTLYTIAEPDVADYCTTTFAVIGGSHDEPDAHALSGALDDEEGVEVQVTNDLTIVVPTGVYTELLPDALFLLFALAALLLLAVNRQRRLS